MAHGLRQYIRFGISNLAMLVVISVTASKSWAVPPEGFETHAMLTKGQGSSSLHSQVKYSKPVWRRADTSLQIYGTTRFAGILFTPGGSVTVANRFNDRSSYFGRLDLPFSPVSSLSVKFMHDEWKYIKTSREFVSAEYSHFFPWDSGGGIYLVFGGYYRWLKQRWNDPWYSPFNFDTDDHEGFITALFGWRGHFSQTSFYTFDIGIRDPYGYYSLDNPAFDLTLNFGDGNGFLWRLLLGARTSAPLVGTWFAAEPYVGLGFVAY